MEKEVLISVKDLKKYFPVTTKKGRQYAKAIDGVTFDIYKGETVGLVGESGCGKTTTGRCILNLIPCTGGEITYEGEVISNIREKAMRPYRAKMQIIFQDPYGCLDPRKTVSEIIAAPLKLQGMKDRAERRKKVLELMEEVGLRSDYADRLPHEFSGGQRQRIGIARALACNPEFIVCDEPVSALDVSVQAQVVNLIHDLQKQHGLTYLFISHDLRVIRHLCDRIVVMYLGVIMEIGSKEDICVNMEHPYTEALLSAVPDVAKKKGARDRILLEGDIPSPINVPTGCRFNTRCPYATERCRTEAPAGRDFGNGHICYCHYTKEERIKK